MLVLTYKPGEHVELRGLFFKDEAGNHVAADTIKITVVEIKGKQVKLGADAPDNIKIVRVKAAS